jgi:hypothetical protein
VYPLVLKDINKMKNIIDEEKSYPNFLFLPESKNANMEKACLKVMLQSREMS